MHTDSTSDGMRGLDIARVRLFFHFNYNGTMYPCALVHWFSRVSNAPDEANGMWIVEPDLNADGSPCESVIHLDCILRAAHLIGVYGDEFLPTDFTFHDTLDTFESFYVNRFIDHHAFEVIF